MTQKAIDKNAANGAPRRNSGARSRRWLPWCGLLALAGLITAGLWPRPTPVETAPTRVGMLRAAIVEEGKTRIRQRYVVSAPVTGQLRRIPLKAGGRLAAGQTVAVIDPLPPALLDARTRALSEARKVAAAANLDRARAAHEFAASELRRVEKLFADKTATAQELESAQWRATAAANDKTAAEGALRQAEAELAEFSLGPDTEPAASPTAPASESRKPIEVKAPVAGAVLRLFEESARTVAAGTPLMETGDPTDLEVIIEVLSRDGAALPAGAPVILEQWGGNQPLEAKVRLVEPGAFTKVSALGVEEQRVRVIADLLTPAEKRPGLGDQFRVEAHIIVWETNRTLKVPAGALFRAGSEWAAYVVNAGRAHLRAVKAGRSSGLETEVIEGLKEGENVILFPGDRVRDGIRVKPIKV